ncbi:MAG: methionine synthase [Planctomycetes bacterium]|nr:methionine synthase [Planctomycetota bacterium]
MAPATHVRKHEALKSLLDRRIVVLDGAMGTLIQLEELDEAAFRGERFADHTLPLHNCNDVLVLTQPDLLRRIHTVYLDVGADVIETNSFNATSIAMEDYGLEGQIYDLNHAAARVACEAVEAWEQAHPGDVRFVAGSMGPTNRMGSLSPKADQPAYRAIDYDGLYAAYYEQARGLIEGGVDMILCETSIDTLNLKAALGAVHALKRELDRPELPVLASITFTQEGSDRILSGQTVDAVWTSIEHFDLTAVLINCALGPEAMRPLLAQLAQVAPIPVGCYPNAGLPNEFGEFDATPESMAKTLGEFAEAGWLNLTGGCCGSRPEHVRAIAEAVKGCAPRQIPSVEPGLRLSGLEVYSPTPGGFTIVGERTNVSGSRKFSRLIREERFEEATEVARKQVTGGANILDVCMDADLIEGPAAMTRFLNQIAAEPDISRIPVMVDSSDWEVLEAGLKVLQGKGVVNSISLKDGEAKFLERARKVRAYGAAAVVMGFDEQGQATSAEHKLQIAERAYTLLTEQAGFPPDDIIYDPNVLAVATGIEEHADYAKNFIEACRLIKARFPRIKLSGGISNVSFAFAGNDVVREAMHAAFLYHAIKAGLDMGIVNAGQLAVYEEVPKKLRDLVEDVIFNRHPGATDALVDYAEQVRGSGKKRVEDLSWREGTLHERFGHALLHGLVNFVDEDVAEALATFPTPLSIIEGPLMDGMGVVGELFGAGKMFLPQVVKSARVMQKAVALIEPHMEREANASRGRLLLATVKGDVHDIGKNIVGVVLACNGYDIIDMGVMQPAQDILDRAKQEGVDLIGLSGLITPSLREMAHVASEMQRQGFTCPLLIGGATTSLKHTAVKIAPSYAGPVVYVKDASKSVDVLGELLSERKDAFVATNHAQQAAAQEAFANRPTRQPLVSIAEARARATPIAWSAEDLSTPRRLGIQELSVKLGDLIPYVDWTPFLHTWELKGTYPAIFEDPQQGEHARKLVEDARALMQRLDREGALQARAVYGLFRAHSEGDDVVLLGEDGAELTRLPQLRQQQQKSTRGTDTRPYQCLADFVAPKASGLSDHVGAFAVTAGLGLEPLVAAAEAKQDPYEKILLQAVADRFAEALAEYLHERVRAEWGYDEVGRLQQGELLKERYRGIRPAPGYPASPDHRIKRRLFALLDVEARTGITLTSGLAMHPAASVSGLYFAHPEAKYFAVGPVGEDQVRDYAQRWGEPIEEAELWLEHGLGYTPSR